MKCNPEVEPGSRDTGPGGAGISGWGWGWMEEKPWKKSPPGSQAPELSILGSGML